MKYKETFRKYVKIEYILIILSIISFCSTVKFKITESKNFQSLINSIDDLKDSSFTNTSAEILNSKIYDLKINFLPFTYYNSKVDNCLNYFTEVLINSNNSYIFEDLQEAYIALLKTMYTQQQQLNRGYIFMLMIAFFMIMVAAGGIIENYVIQRNQLRIIQALNDNQVKISREIHDGVAQDLAALKICIQNNDNEKIAFFAEQAFNEVRFLLETTHINLTDSLENIIREVVKDFQNNFHIKSDVYIASDNIQYLPQNYQLELLRILNEALSNIARHSKANQITIKITDIINGLRFIISDNGIGIQSQAQNNTNDVRKHFGIENIKDRVHEMNGSIDFSYEGGTTIAITLKNFIS